MKLKSIIQLAAILAIVSSALLGMKYVLHQDGKNQITNIVGIGICFVGTVMMYKGWIGIRSATGTNRDAIMFFCAIPLVVVGDMATLLWLVKA